MRSNFRVARGLVPRAVEPVVSGRRAGVLRVVLAGKVVLGETVSRRRWAGTLVITLGVMLVAIAGSQA